MMLETSTTLNTVRELIRGAGQDAGSFYGRRDHDLVRSPVVRGPQSNRRSSYFLSPSGLRAK
jgi:hypothetical protein